MSDESATEEWKRRRRRAEIFGEALPETTRDERDQAESGARGGAGDAGESASDRWLKSQVPPHHGG